MGLFNFVTTPSENWILALTVDSRCSYKGKKPYFEISLKLHFLYPYGPIRKKL
jgi:hypothetical protein